MLPVDTKADVTILKKIIPETKGWSQRQEMTANEEKKIAFTMGEMELLLSVEKEQD